MRLQYAAYAAAALPAIVGLPSTGARATILDQTFSSPFTLVIPTESSFSSFINIPTFNNSGNTLQSASVSIGYESTLSGTYVNDSFAPYGTLITAVNDSINFNLSSINAGVSTRNENYALDSVYLGGPYLGGAPPFTIPETSFTSSNSLSVSGSAFKGQNVVGGNAPVTATSTVVKGTGSFFGDMTLAGTVEVTYTYKSLSPYATWYNNNVVPLGNALSNSATNIEWAAAGGSVWGAAELAAGFPAGVEALDIEAEMLSVSYSSAILGNLHDVPLMTDPPLILPIVTPSGPFTQTIITDFQNIQEGEFNLVGLISKLQNSIQQLETMIGNGTTTGGNIVESQILTERSELSALSKSQGILFFKAVADLKATDFDNTSFTTADETTFVDDLEFNGFPAPELAIFKDLGFTTAQVADMLNEAVGVDLSDLPTSLFAFLDQAGVDQLDLAAATSAVPEPSTWVMVLVGFGALGFATHRRALRTRRL